MELNWTTFALELLNFLVLVWLLQHFLFRPVRAAIERRRQNIEADMAAAQEKSGQAQQLLEQQRVNLAAWEQQRQAARDTLQKEIDAEREQRMTELDKSLAAESQRLKSLDEHKSSEQWRQLEQQAVSLSARFATKLLSRFASPELEQLILAAVIEDLAQLPAERREKLRSSLNEPDHTILVSSAYAVAEQLQQRLCATLQNIAGKEALDLKYEIDPELLCGARIAVDSLQIGANLRSELMFFAEAEHGH